MDSGYYAACAGLVARTQALDTIANNLANVSTSGFRASKNVFSSLLTSTDSDLSVLNQDANNYGVLSGTLLDTSQGSLTPTGNDLDFAIDGTGYFQVQTSSGMVYSRGGSFRVSPKGQLVTAAGDLVMGQNGPIAIPGAPVTVSADGTITANGAIAGRLKLVEFPANTRIQSAGGTYYQAPGVTPVNATSSNVRQGMLESSNVNSIASLVELISAQREVETMRRALTMFNNEIDRTATQELPKVS